MLMMEVGLRRFLILILATFILFFGKQHDKITDERSLC
jgi:hypothetical protein